MLPIFIRQADRAEQTASPLFFWWIWLFWLFFLVQPLLGIIQMPPSPVKVISAVGIILFVAMYMWVTWHNAFHYTRILPIETGPERQWWKIIGLMTILGSFLCFVQGANALGAFIYISAGMAGQLPGRRVVQIAIGLSVLEVILGILIKAPWFTVGQMPFIIGAVATVVYFFGQAIRTNQALQVARREIARLAVSEERLRFARDLHDLLGHSLSLITLKSELAGQLIAEDPAQAQREVRDIEQAARTALQEVREAVAGYRQSTLADELQRARELLRAAGIRCVVRDEVGALPAPSEALLTWVVREGVTNVMRHSRAKQCVVAITQTLGEVRMTVTDDGLGDNRKIFDAATSDLPSGNGLRGIAERVAALNGRCEVGSLGERGFRLAVTLPIAPAPDQDSALLAPTKEASV